MDLLELLEEGDLFVVCVILFLVRPQSRQVRVRREVEIVGGDWVGHRTRVGSSLRQFSLADCIDVICSLSKLQLDGLLGDRVLEEFDVRAEVAAEEVPAVARLEMCVGHDVEGLDTVVQKLQGHGWGEARGFWNHKITL